MQKATRTKLPPPARALINEHSESKGLAVSAVTFWEIGMLTSKGRISLPRQIEAWRNFILDVLELTEIPLTGDIALEASHLPEEFHGDPADRLLVATTRMLGLTIATRDRKILGYSSIGLVDAIAV